MKQQPNLSKVAILDAGAQYGKVIDRRVRELNLYSELLPIETPFERLKNYQAVIISGGPDSVYTPNAPKADPKLFQNSNIAVLGICYGMQLMNYERGGNVSKGKRREDGPSIVSLKTSSPLFKQLSKKEQVLMSHGDSVTKIPQGFSVCAMSGNIIAAIENQADRLYAVQFHPEVDLTINGKTILKNFLFDIAECKPSYTLENRESKAIQEIKKQVGKKHVLVLVSGGVDSTVCAALIKKALPQKHIHAFHIDSGFMRKNESKTVKKALEKLGLRLEVIDASQDFLSVLKNVSNPEEKRHKIGEMYIKCTQAAIKSKKLNSLDLMIAQGTLRPDLIESASHLVSSKAQTIKTHHNDAPIVRSLRKKGMILEPLQEYHKDEVRILGMKLGLPKSVVWRQPFPGPGLAIRILCTDKNLHLNDLPAISSELKKFSTPSKAIIPLPVKSVGVQGDERSYKLAVAITGTPSWKANFELAKELPKRVHRINRVTYLIGPMVKNSSVISVTPTSLNIQSIRQLQEADSIVNTLLQRYNLREKISQMPVILLPISFDTPGKRSIVLRPFLTNDFMTGLPAIPGGRELPKHVLSEMAKLIQNEVPGISRVLYDLTSKPPGTTEWE